MKYLLLFFISFSGYSQIEIKINTINSFEISPKKRKFVIDYQISNKENKEIKFFLLPHSLIANSASSLTLFPVYKIYLNGVFEDVDGPFYETFFGEQNDIYQIINEEDKKKQIEILTSKLEEEYKNIIANYKSDRVNRDDNWIYTNQKLLQSIVYLKPNETKNFQIITFWDKQRYFKIDENEYYLDENEKYEFELSLYLDKLNRKEKLTEEEFTKIKNDENFIEGRFSSNKMKINFGE
jgi:hypothetical protein